MMTVSPAVVIRAMGNCWAPTAPGAAYGAGVTDNAPAASPVRHCQTRLHEDMIFDVVPTDDPNVCITCSNDRTIARFDFERDVVLDRWSGHSACVNKVVFAPRSHLTISCSRDKSIRFWKAGEAAAVGVIADAHRLTIPSITISDSEEMMCSGARDYNVTFWDVATLTKLRTAKINLNVITSLKWIPKEEIVVQCSEDLDVRLWDARIGAVAQSFTACTDFALCCDISSDGAYILTGYNGFNPEACVLRMWDRRTLKLVQTFTGHDQSIRSCSFLHSNDQPSRAVSTGKDRTVKVWDLLDGAQCLSSTTIDHSSYFTCIASDPNRAGQVYAGCAAGFLGIWNVDPDGIAQLQTRTLAAETASEEK